MADTYGVTTVAIAQELPGLYPNAFSPLTTPTDSQVAGAISTADTIIALWVRGCVGQAPSVSDAAAPLAVRFIIEWVKAQVVRIAYAGNDPVQVATAAKPYSDNAQAMKDAIQAMGAQAEGEGDPSPQVEVSNTVPLRALIVGDCDLSGCFNPHPRF